MDLLSSDRDLLPPEDRKLLFREDLLQGTWVPLTWTGEVGLPPDSPDPTEESSLDSDLGTDLADPELMDPEPAMKKHEIEFQYYVSAWRKF